MKIPSLFEGIPEGCEPMPIFGNGAELLLVPARNEEAFYKATKELSDKGFDLYSERKDSHSLHATYVCGTDVINVSFTEGDACLRIVSEEADSLPPRAVDAKFKSVTTPLVTQVKLMYVGADCGMSYLIRLSDGRFIMIDGGIGEHDEVEHLYSLMCEQNVLSDGPTVAAWFITHAHWDHFNAFSKFCRLFPTVAIGDIVYNWPRFDMTSSPSDLTVFSERVGARTDSRHIIPRQGNSFFYADAQFDVLFVCDVIYPERIPNINDTSLVMKMSLGGYTFLWLGDAQKQASDVICTHFTPDELKCDFLQVGHHGYGGGSHELYSAADPAYLLWPIPDFWYKRIRAWECNKLLVESKNIRSVMNTGQNEYVIDLTKPIPEVNADGAYPAKHVIYSEDFSSCSPLALNWSCVRGGKTGYGGLKIEFPDVGRCMVTADERYSVCEVLRRGLCRGVSDYTFTLCGRNDGDNVDIGFYLNYQKPYEWSDDQIAWLTLPEGDFDISIKASTESETLTYMQNGKTVLSRPYEYEDNCAFHFVLRNASLIFTKITITDDSLNKKRMSTHRWRCTY